VPQVWWGYLCEVEDAREKGSQVIYGKDFTVKVWDPRRLRRTYPECGCQIRTKGARLCAEWHCRKVGRMKPGQSAHI